jgi:hypothetical protein
MAKTKTETSFSAYVTYGELIRAIKPVMTLVATEALGL